VLGIHALAGGTHARTYLIRTADPEREFIHREFPPGDDTACDESRVLSALRGLGGLAPRLLASGTGGAPSEGSWTLISWASRDLLASAPAVLTHYDFWSGNTLWEDGVLTGVVD
jgi:hypothetical protein